MLNIHPNQFKHFRITARGLIVLDNKLLLVSDDGVDWYTPGGRLEPEESLSYCMEREVYEETGLIVQAGPLIYIHECLDIKYHIHKIHHFFLATILEGDLNSQWIDEGGSVEHRRYFSLEEIKENPKVFPRFLAEGQWCHAEPEVVEPKGEGFNHYRGCDYVRGHEVIKPYKGQKLKPSHTSEHSYETLTLEV